MSITNNCESLPVTHCIFDLDGTLIDSEAYLTNAINAVTKRFGKKFDWELKSKVVGLHLALSGPIIIKELNLPLTLEEYIELVIQEFKIEIESCDFMPGAKELILHLHSHGIPMALCTGSTNATFTLKKKNFGDFFDAGKYFQHVVIAGDDPDVKRNKPYPDPYHVCLQRFHPKPDPNHVLVFEDSPTGVTSAVSAGLKCIMTPDPRLDQAQCLDASLVIQSLKDFDPQIFGLPKFSI